MAQPQRRGRIAPAVMDQGGGTKVKTGGCTGWGLGGTVDLEEATPGSVVTLEMCQVLREGLAPSEGQGRCSQIHRN